MAKQSTLVLMRDGRWAVNTTNGRAVTTAPFGYACYQGEIVNGQYEGVHRGVVGTREDIERWLRGEQPEGLIQIYDEGAHDH